MSSRGVLRSSVAWTSSESYVGVIGMDTSLRWDGRRRANVQTSSEGRVTRGSHLRAIPPSRFRWGLLVLAGLCSAFSLGCMRSLWNDFLDPSEVGRFYGRPVTSEIRTTLGLQDEDTEFSAASEPLPEDIVPILKEYQIGPSDWVEITIQELIRAGSTTTETRKVSDLGYISLPILGAVKIGGLTERQAEDVLRAKLKPDILSDPIVSVVVRTEQQRQFVIVGYAYRPGPQAIPRADFRMLEAISYAGQLPEEVETAYVIRRIHKQAVEGGDAITTPSQPPGEPAGPPATAPADASGASSIQKATKLHESVDILMSDLGGGATGSATTASRRVSTSSTSTPSSTSTVSRPASRRSQATPEEREEMLQALLPGSMPTNRAKAPKASATQGTTSSAESSKELSKWIWLNGEWVELRGEAARQGPASTGAVTPLAPAPAPSTGVAQPTRPSEPSSEPSTDWGTDTTGAEDTRVISIPLKQLRSGEARYNIVVQAGDVISLPMPDAGKRYYVMGHVRGPGAYMIPTEGITLRGAIAAAGGLDPYAWPSRCEISRRIAGDQQELHQIDLDRIYTMKDPDIKLKPGDVVNIGTSPLSPFMVTIANGFRTTYGFGFVYDRNFGDIDSFGGQANPKDRRRAEEAVRNTSLKATFPGL